MSRGARSDAVDILEMVEGSTMPEVTRGAGLRAQEPDPLAAVRRAAEESQAADAALRKAALEAHAAGQSPRQIAEVAGVAHTTIYRWIKDGEPR